jgi:hypothetical protein
MFLTFLFLSKHPDLTSIAGAVSPFAFSLACSNNHFSRLFFSSAAGASAGGASSG